MRGVGISQMGWDGEEGGGRKAELRCLRMPESVFPNDVQKEVEVASDAEKHGWADS